MRNGLRQDRSGQSLCSHGEKATGKQRQRRCRSAFAHDVLLPFHRKAFFCQMFAEAVHCATQRHRRRAQNSSALRAPSARRALARADGRSCGGRCGHRTLLLDPFSQGGSTGSASRPSPLRSLSPACGRPAADHRYPTPPSPRSPSAAWPPPAPPCRHMATTSSTSAARASAAARRCPAPCPTTGPERTGIRPRSRSGAWYRAIGAGGRASGPRGPSSWACAITAAIATVRFATITPTRPVWSEMARADRAACDPARTHGGDPYGTSKQ
jgi:hypothetical protein